MTAAASPTPPFAASGVGQVPRRPTAARCARATWRPRRRCIPPAVARGSSTRCSRATLITDGFRSDEVHEALDLCLSCKGCKSDCPVNVDMATYKAEFLSRLLQAPPATAAGLHDGTDHAARPPRRSTSPRLANFAHPAPGPRPGWSSGSAGSARSARCRASRTQTFKSWFEGRGEVNPTADPVVLFPDTFNDYLHPEPMKAATRVLEAAGYRVVVPQARALLRPPALRLRDARHREAVLAADARGAAAATARRARRSSGSSRAASRHSATSFRT